MPLLRPEPLTEAHDLTAFNSGVASLDDWLKRRARTNQASGASRTFILTEDKRVIGYYALASGAITVADSVGRFRRNMPDPVPVAVLGRLAIDQSQQGRGLGRALFRDCAPRGPCRRRHRHPRDRRACDLGTCQGFLPGARLRSVAERADDADGHAGGYPGVARLMRQRRRYRPSGPLGTILRQSAYRRKRADPPHDRRRHHPCPHPLPHRRRRGTPRPLDRCLGAAVPGWRCRRMSGSSRQFRRHNGSGHGISYRHLLFHFRDSFIGIHKNCLRAAHV